MRRLRPHRPRRKLRPLIRSSFRLAPGVGPFLESRLWDAGIRRWDDFPAGDGAAGALSPAMDARLRAAIAPARAALDAGDADALAVMLPRATSAGGSTARSAGTPPSSTSRPTATRSPRSASSTRAARGSSSPAATSSGSPRRRAAGSSSSPSTASPSTCRCSGARSAAGARRARTSTCGTSGRRLGHAGGLKLLEATAGVRRPPHLAGLRGLDAVRLWRAHEAGDPAALRLFAEYNLHDTVNLRTLMDLGYNRMIERLRLPAEAVRVQEPGDVRYDVTKLLLSL